MILSMLGCVVGTGNIWRFPRIMATHAEEGGTQYNNNDNNNNNNNNMYDLDYYKHNRELIG